MGLHVVIAEATRTPEIALNMDEGKHIMGSAQNVLRHYGVQGTQKTADWIAFVGAVSIVYVPRLIAISAKKKAQTIEQQPRPSVQPGVSVAADAPPGSPAETLFAAANVAHPEDGF